ncbi:MAG: DNA repair protein RecO [Bacilli bacterium]|nr:DNA repair protein RecO [Bacilli bacterium]MDD4298057.1 DNA repair protein RecO [Bacilli bacterium]MDD4644083.1 DNA repair protein RecO [Bacilli bacterium]
MKIEKVEGVVISERNYGETSKLIVMITKEHGLISVMAKGARKMRSTLRGISSKLTYGYFHIYYKEGKISTLIDADIINSFKVIRRDLLTIGYASFVCELVGQVIKQSIMSKDLEVIYDYFISSLIKINEGFDPLVITNILELKLLPFLGVNPMLDECAVCGDVTSIVTVSADKFGFLCQKCRTNEYIVNDKTIKFLRMFYYVDISKISKLEISDKVKNEINYFIDDFYDKHTGLYLKSKQFLKKIEVIS